jgi:hypothetical protein
VATAAAGGGSVLGVAAAVVFFLVEEGAFPTLGEPFPTGIPESLDPSCLLVPLVGRLARIDEAAGILLADLVPLLVTGRAVVVGLVGVVLEKEGMLVEERADFGFIGRNPLVDLLNRSEIGAKRIREYHRSPQ